MTPDPTQSRPLDEVKRFTVKGSWVSDCEVAWTKEQMVLASDYEALRSALSQARALHETRCAELRSADKDATRLNIALSQARARNGELIDLLDYARAHLGWTVGAEQHICERVEAIMSTPSESSPTKQI